MRKRDLKEERDPQPPAEPLEEHEPVEWDGSEAELVADSNEPFQEPGTGIVLTYVLKEQEIYECLLRDFYSRKRKWRTALEAVLLLGGAAAFLAFYLRSGNASELTFGIICLLFLAVVLGLPFVNLRGHARKNATGEEIRMEVYSDRIVMGHPGRQWEIPLDGATERMETGGRLALYPPQGRMVILPLRCVEPSVLPDVKAAVLAGTRVRE